MFLGRVAKVKQMTTYISIYKDIEKIVTYQGDTTTEEVNIINKRRVERGFDINLTLETKSHSVNTETISRMERERDRERHKREIELKRERERERK